MFALVDESWDVFAKRVHVEQTFAVSCVKTQGGATSPLCSP